MADTLSLGSILKWDADFRRTRATGLEGFHNDYHGPRTPALKDDEARCTEAEIILFHLCEWGTVEIIRQLLAQDLERYLDSRQQRFNDLQELGKKLEREATRLAADLEALRAQRLQQSARLPGDDVLDRASKEIQGGLEASGQIYATVTSANGLLGPVLRVIRRDRTIRRLFTAAEGAFAFLLFNVGFGQLEELIKHAAESVNRTVPLLGLSVAFVVSLAASLALFVVEDRILTPWYEERLDRWTRRRLANTILEYYDKQTTLEYKLAGLEEQVKHALEQAVQTRSVS